MTQRPFNLRNKPRKLEAPGQEKCVAMLRAYMPDQVWWSASIAGVRLSGAAIGAAVRGGIQRGAPDFSFIFPDGVTRYVEMKFGKDDFSPNAPNGRLSDEQKLLQGYLGRKMVVCSSWDGVRPMKPVVGAWLELYGLAWLTERESLQREGRRRDAERAKMIAKAKPLRLRA